MTDAELAKAAQDGHQQNKDRISERETSRFKTLLGIEGISELLIGAVLTILLKVLPALIVIPDLTFSKVLAVLAAIGVGLALVYVAAKVILYSLDDFQKIRNETAAAEKAEDKRYKDELKQIYAS